MFLLVTVDENGVDDSWAIDADELVVTDSHHLFMSCGYVVVSEANDSVISTEEVDPEDVEYDDEGEDEIPE